MHSARKKPSPYRTLRISVRLTREEHAGLKALCTEMRISYSELLEAFVADATQSSRCCGSDFEWWLEMRGFGHRFLSCYGKGETLVAEAEISRRLRWLGLWQGIAWSARSAMP